MPSSDTSKMTVGVDQDGSVNARDLADEPFVERRRLDGQCLTSESGRLLVSTFRDDDKHCAVFGVGCRRGERPEGVAVPLPEHTAGDVVEALTLQPRLGQPRRFELHGRQRDACMEQLPGAVAYDEQLDHRL